jgi:hypothetical protein
MIKLSEIYGIKITFEELKTMFPNIYLNLNKLITIRYQEINDEFINKFIMSSNIKDLFENTEGISLITCNFNNTILIGIQSEIRHIEKGYSINLQFTEFNDSEIDILNNFIRNNKILEKYKIEKYTCCISD